MEDVREVVVRVVLLVVMVLVWVAVVVEDMLLVAQWQGFWTDHQHSWLHF